MNLPASVAVFTCLVCCLALSPPAHGLPTEHGERLRRSLLPNPPAPSPQGKGNVDVNIHRERGVGTVVSGKAEGNIYRSPDGNTRVDAHGHWSRVYDGPARGQREHGAGVRFSHSW